MSVHDILTGLAALSAVIVMILLIRHGPRLLGAAAARGGTNAALSLSATLPLDAKRRLCLVSCEGQRLLLLTGGPSDVLLGWLPPAAPPAELER